MIPRDLWLSVYVAYKKSNTTGITYLTSSPVENTIFTVFKERKDFSMSKVVSTLAGKDVVISTDADTLHRVNILLNQFVISSKYEYADPQYAYLN